MLLLKSVYLPLIRVAQLSWSKAGMAFDNRLLPECMRACWFQLVRKQSPIPADRKVVHESAWIWFGSTRMGKFYCWFVRIGQVVQNDQVEIVSGLAEGELVLPLPSP